MQRGKKLHKRGMYTYQSIFKDLYIRINACQQADMWAVRINEFVTSGSLLQSTW